MHHLEFKGEPPSKPYVEKCVYVIDGNALIQSIVNPPETFAELASVIFSRAEKTAVVHFVTDCYKPQSIKSFERSRRGKAPMVCIGGPKTLVPNDFQLFLCNDENKTANYVFTFSVEIGLLCQVTVWAEVLL